ncbi:TIGR03857 family LLM class F420-dependent oxidoreductase [Williamsia deligens]|uniref:TIGR03857 family LLM class F420-dependent oxidoreductase n=1 Tax=Williamsia deligens TaxID=321325 RepID=A0ABW3G717_9NOCA|nr:TIGR03857 family LLM class F420-dependent oxidoreductase [Williamsia deligens]MCP2193322.1 putative F420-dependent oxidoreductase, MSMEG_2249 family [Williamsia deligens]
MSRSHPDLGCYLLAGQPDSSRDILDEARTAERLGIGTAFISERYNRKEAVALAGAAVAVTESITVATAATNHNTRHLMVTAGMTRTLRDLSGGRFVLGLGRGIPILQSLYGLPLVTTAALEDTAGLLRRLFRGEMVGGHDGPAGHFPLLHLDSSLDEHLPLALVAFGPQTLALGGRCFDEVVLHTYFTPETTQRCVRTVKEAAEKAGRDPSSVRVWSCLATVGDHLPETVRLRKTVGRLGTYLQGYGDLLVRTNDWDPAVLQRFLADPVVSSIAGLDIAATPDQLEHAASLLPDEWLANAAVGSPETCAAAIRGQRGLGCDAVILHGSTPTELEPIVDAYESPPTKHSLV